MSDLPAPAPDITSETAPFWAATAEGRLLIPRCPGCDRIFWYPRAICPMCLHSTVDWIEASGDGTIYSFTVLRRPGGPYRELGALVIAYVELAEGPRLLTNIVGSSPEALAVGARVRLVFSPTSSDAALYRFELAG